MTKYIEVRNEDNAIAISQIFKSWYLKKVERLEKYLKEYSVDVTDTKFVDGNGSESVPSTLYRGAIPDEEDTLIVLSNPSLEPLYIWTGYGVASVISHYSKPATSYVYKVAGKGLIFHIAGDSREIVEDVRVLTFSPTRNNNSGFGLQIFDGQSKILFSATDYPIKLLAHRKTDYSSSPRYFYLGSDDVQGAVYDTNNYYQYSSPEKAIGFFCDVAVKTPIYANNRIHHAAHGVAAKMTKNTISTGIMELHYKYTHTKHYYMDGTESSVTYFKGQSQPSFNGTNGGTCEQSTFSVFDVTNYY